MATYIHLMELGRENLETMEHSPDRRAAARELVESYGGEIVSIYYTLGRYDVVSVVEYPDQGAAARAAIRFRGAGNTRVETLPAFTEGEWDEAVVAELAE
ncbi:GYD domain-containing protein [Natronomonas salina]|uniref:GYD domain-containing protein n=1 Tax=Natronomonas salina TaxID=1710540 RepID=UPI0015B5F4AB|nr:GYD domain-containing protein [Natronomonas salina]QLD90511.1 GYD domain-containing protein [Natronomonas salina]